MDKDSIIIKHLQNEVNEAEIRIAELEKCNNSKKQTIKDLESKINEVYTLLNMKKKEQISVLNESSYGITANSNSYSVVPYEELYQKASQSLISRGLDIDSINYHSLISDAELIVIEKEMNSGLKRNEKWEIRDYIAVFIAASIGSLVEFILSDRNNKFTGKESDFSQMLNEFHKHEGKSPLDYQGKGFGGGYHRALSKGHDVTRFIEGITMIKNGRFEGLSYENGKSLKIVSTVNQYGSTYQQLELIEAILKYAKHMFADLLSTCSLPFPGSSFFVEDGNEYLRKLVVTMYQNGFNLKNIMSQSLSTIIVEIILRTYFGVMSVQKYNDNFELTEDYGNFAVIKKLVKPNKSDKINEMMLISHTIVTAMNIGKIVIKKNPWEINVTEIISVVKYSIPVVNGVVNRHSEYEKLIVNSHGKHLIWEKLITDISLEDTEREFIIDKLVIE